jgi:anti-sigma factor RsiW
MSCENVQELVSALLDGRVAAEEEEVVLAHIGTCRQCGSHFETLQTQRMLVRSLAQPAIPEGLTASLKVMASHERERRLARISFSVRVQRWTSRIHLAFDNLMRPVALPFTGGLLSTMLIFALLVPNLSFSHDIRGQEFFTAPVGSLVTNPYGQIGEPDAYVPRIESMADPISDYVNVVDLTIDARGKVVDWSVVRGQLTDDMKSIILFSTFTPATAFGVDTSSRIRISQSLPPCVRVHCSATVRG